MPRMPAKPKPPFAAWLTQARERRGQSQVELADVVSRTQEYISLLERGVRKPSRDTIERLAAALAPEDADEDIARNLLNEGLLAAGFAPVGASEYDDDEAIDYLRGMSPPQRAKALKVLKAMFDEEDRKDNEGTIGKRAD